MSLLASAFTARLKRIVIVTSSVIGLALAGYVIATMLSMLIVFAHFIFSGGSGKGLDPFRDHFLIPALAFSGGALVFGGAMAIVSSVFASGRLWFKTIATTAVLGGLVTALTPTLQSLLAAHVAPVQDALKKLLLTPM